VPFRAGPRPIGSVRPHKLFGCDAQRHHPPAQKLRSCRAACRAVSSVPTNRSGATPHRATLNLTPSPRANTQPADPALALDVAPWPARTSPACSDGSIILIGVILSKESGLGFSIGAPPVPKAHPPAMAAALGGLPTRNAHPRQFTQF
jgi:hypothetical protein